MAGPFAASVTAVALAGTAVLGAAVGLPESRGAAAADPMTYFQKLVPVFTHPRCLNCHGATDPLTGLGHGGGAIDSVADCTSCHDASPPPPHDWKLAPSIFSFIGKDARALCTMQADFAMTQGVGGYIQHLETDSLIGLGFEGRAGGARDPDPPAPPPMGKREFLDAAAEWLNAGNGACVEEGTIRETRQVVSNEAWHPAPNIAATMRLSGRREVTIRESNGQFTAHTVVLGESVLRQVLSDPSCSATILQNSSYSGTHDGPATVRSTVKPDGDYTITVSGPRETYRELVTGSSNNTCGLPRMVQDPDEHDLVWPAWTITIKGRLANPRDRRRLAGVGTRTIVNQADVQGGIEGDAGETEYLSSFLSLSTQDGKSIPIEVTTDWNLLYGR